MVNVIPPRYNPGMTQRRPKATYADVLAAPEHMVAEVLDGELFLFPRPAPRHAMAHTSLGGWMYMTFGRGRGEPGGWLILNEPELHMHDDIMVPDIAGWRVERMPRLPAEAYFTTPPDWVCEVLSPSTRRVDRIRKLPIYAKNGIPHAWLVDPIERSLEMLKLYREHWLLLGVASDDERVRAEPFDAVELDLAVLWADLEPVPVATP